MGREDSKRCSRISSFELLKKECNYNLKKVKKIINIWIDYNYFYEEVKQWIDPLKNWSPSNKVMKESQACKTEKELLLTVREAGWLEHILLYSCLWNDH
jgi:hypothetical protein